MTIPRPQFPEVKNEIFAFGMYIAVIAENSLDLVVLEFSSMETE